MSAFTKLKNFILKEPQNKNESPKIVVVLRVSAIIFALALLSAVVGFLSVGRFAIASTLAVFILLYIYMLWCTYQDKVHFAYTLLNFITVFWICGIYVLFGPDTGVHHFILALIVVDLLVDRRHPVRTLLILYGIRIACIFANRAFADMEWLPVKMQIYLYFSSIVLEGLIILINGVYFTRDAFQMESCLQEYNRELQHAASTDSLTGLWNRYRIIDYTETCLKGKAKINSTFMAVAIGDIDYFKRINDTYGHECGDEVLKQLADLFRSHMEGKGAVARWGGEEFLFLFDHMNGDDAWNELSRMQLLVNRLRIPYEDQVIQVSMTIGLTEYDRHLSMDENIKLADDKLYTGKQRGRNRIVY